MGSVSRNVPGISLGSRGSGQWGSPRDSKHARRDPCCAPVSCAGQNGFFIWALHVPQSTLTMSWDSTFTNQIYWIHWNQKISYPKLNCSMFECQILNDEYNICQTHPNANSRILTNTKMTFGKACALWVPHGHPCVVPAPHAPQTPPLNGPPLESSSTAHYCGN